MKEPLYGHTSEETAYLVEDYPYGVRLRCQIRYWLEHSPTHGWRFVSQTTNPKKAGVVWNKPKKSPYLDLAAVMYRDVQGHVTWEGLSQYDSIDRVRAFVEHYPKVDLKKLFHFALAKTIHLRELCEGQRYFTINGVRQERSELQQKEDRQELEAWKSMVDQLKVLTVPAVVLTAAG